MDMHGTDVMGADTDTYTHSPVQSEALRRRGFQIHLFFPLFFDRVQADFPSHAHAHDTPSINTCITITGDL